MPFPLSQGDPEQRLRPLPVGGAVQHQPGMGSHALESKPQATIRKLRAVSVQRGHDDTLEGAGAGAGRERQVDVRAVARAIAVSSTRPRPGEKQSAVGS